MSRYLPPPPGNFNPTEVIKWLSSVYQAFGNLQDPTTTNVVTDTTLRNENAGIILVANTVAITITLPSAKNVAGLRFCFVKTTNNSYAATIDGYSSETINGSATNTELDSQYDYLEIISDGTNWVIANMGASGGYAVLA